MDQNNENEHVTRVSLRHWGRLYEAAVVPNGSTSITRDGIWICNADWNGRALDSGSHELHADLDASNAILDGLADAILATAHRRRSRRGGRD